MTTSIVIVIALVVVAIGVFAALARGKGGRQLQAPPSSRAVPGPPSQPPPKRTSERPAVPPRNERLPSTAPAPQGEARTGATARSPSPPAATEPTKPLTTPPGPSVPPSKRDVAGLRKGLAASRGGFVARLSALFQGKKEIGPAILEQVEEVMLTSDVGPKTTQAILARLRGSLERNELRDAEASRILQIGGGAVRLSAKPTVVLMVGVNGVGKTTTIGKLATRYNAAGK